jgi:hypothetical protein
MASIDLNALFDKISNQASAVSDKLRVARKSIDFAQATIDAAESAVSDAMCSRASADALDSTSR